MKLLRNILVLLIIFLLGGCGQKAYQESMTPPPAEVTSPVAPSKEPEETPMPEPVATKSPEAVETVTPSPTPENVDEPAPTPADEPEGDKALSKNQVTHEDLSFIYDNQTLELGKKRDAMESIIAQNILYSEIDAETFEEFTVSIISYEDGTEAVYTDDELYSLKVINDKYVTPRGLKVGDTVERLLELYDKPNPDRFNESTYYYEYMDSGYVTFIVHLKDNRVEMIEITLVM
jgi:predicted small lipoprotein YifL